MRPPTIRTGLLGTGAALALLLTGLVPATAATASATAAAASTAQSRVLADDTLRPTVRSKGEWVVTSTPAGTVLRWTPKNPVPMGDARVEFALDGRVLGAPLATSVDGPLTLDVAGLESVDPSRLSALLGGRRVDAAAPAPSVSRRSDAGTSAAGPAAKLTQPKQVLKKDPGKKGKYKTTRFRYATPGVTLNPLYPAKTEVVAEVVLPTAKAKKGKLPVVVFLHGRHATCYQGAEASGDWPCPTGWTSIQSYRGYRYAATLLASQGFATVSISANGINAQDWVENDGGAASRAALVEHHLGLLAKANAGTSGVTSLKALKGRLNLKKTILVGHSRGGEGVNRATTTLARSTSVSVKGQVLIAPTAFGLQTAPGIPTSVILPYCDGDVYDLQGQTYVDQARQGVTGDTAIKSAQLVLGANHNYFNSHWTPGQTKAPANDDWFGGESDECGAKNKNRLSAKQQQAVAATYIAATVRAVLSKDTSAARLLDGSPVRAASAGKAIVTTASTKGRRSMVVNPSYSTTRIKAAKGATATTCAGGTSYEVTSCLDTATTSSPHWLGYSAGAVPWATAVHATWTKKKARITLKPGNVRNLSSKKWLDLRVIEGQPASTSSFDVVLRDSKNRSLRLASVQKLAQLPTAPELGSRQWAQLVRFAIPTKAKKFDLKRITSVQIVPTSSKGDVYVLDVTATRNGLGKPGISIGSLPQINGSDTTQKVTPLGNGTARIDMTFTISGTVRKAARVWTQTLNSNWDVTERAVTIKPGQKSFTLSTTVIDDGTYPTGGTVMSAVLPQREILTNQYLGTTTATSTVDPPVIDVPTKDITVTQGEPLVWTVTQTGAMSRESAWVWAETVPAAPGAAELRAGDVPASWLLARTEEKLPPSAPLSQTGVGIYTELQPFDTQGRLLIPTSATAALGGPRTVTLIIPADGIQILTDIVLTGTVNPKP